MNRFLSKRMIWSLVGAFLLGVVAGSVGELRTAAASQQARVGRQSFGPDRVKSVPREFIEGGDLSYTALKESLAEVREGEARLEKLEAATERLERSVGALPARLDAANAHLARIARNTEPPPA